ncbi:MAG: pyridoxamine 5'-phosphate oxidase family protein [Acidobacteria bacterium]|nr:pyridoxamine 5'-phosphate oxidase family protein [Acidobacteriota bacterium]
MAPQNQHSSRTVLGTDECLRFLREADFARVVSSIRCLPVARPTRIAVIGDDHLILTSRDDTISSLATRGDVLAVQIDGLEGNGATWSVTVSGIAAPANPDEELPASLARELERGATLLALPLNLVTGVREE